MIRIIAALAVLVAASTPARADPILTPIFTTLVAQAFAAAGITASATAIAITAAVLSAVTMTAIGIGLTMLLTKKPKPIDGQDGQVPIQQPIPFRNFGYGTMRYAGVYLLHEEVSGYLARVQALASHRISAITQIYFNDDPVIISGVSPPVTVSGPVKGYLTVANGEFRYSWPWVIVDTRYGEDEQSYFAFIGALAVSGGSAASTGIWGPQHKGNGIAMIASTCQAPEQKYYGSIYPYGPPMISCVIDFAFVYDPRDPTQDVNDESTWKFSRNSFLQILHYTCFNPFGPRRTYSKVVSSTLPRWIQAINDCDNFVARKGGGTERRYQAGAVFTTEQDRRVIYTALLGSCDGWMCERGDGSIDVEAGVYREPTSFIYDSDIIGYKFSTDQSSRIRVNRSSANWTSPAHGYSPVPTDVVDDYEDQARRGGPPNAAVLDLMPVQSVGQASRLHKRERQRQAARLNGTMVLRWSGLDIAYCRRAKILSNALPLLNNKVIEIRDRTISFMEQTITISFVVVGAEIDDYNPATDESSVPPIPTRPNSYPLEPPIDITATAVQMVDSAGVPQLVVEVSWPDPFDGVSGAPVRTYAVRWRDATNNGSWIEILLSELTPNVGTYTMRTGVVPSDITVEISVAAIAGSNYSTWSSPPEEVDTSASSVAPSQPTNFSAANGVGSSLLSAKMPASSNAVKLQFYRAASGAGFGSATPVGIVTGVPLQTLTYTDTVAAGVYDYFVVAMNAYDIPSSPTGPDSATIS